MPSLPDESDDAPSGALPPASPGWLETAAPRLAEAARTLSRAGSADETLRLAITEARSKFGFSRIGIWLFENGRESAVGAYGVGIDGELTDERGLRIFDRTGFLSEMATAWERYPYYFSKTSGALRGPDARVVGVGNHITAPMIHGGELRGFVAVDDLIESASVNDKAGYLLCQYALLVGSLYFEKVATERMRQAEEACAQAERVKSEFLGMMSHEIRTPLNAIMGYAQLLGNDPSAANIKSLARTIEGCSDHLAELINAILEYAQLSGTDLEAWYKPCDPVEIARAAVGSFERAYGEKGLLLEFRHEGSLAGLVEADAVSLRQILNNLLQNALKFTPTGSVQLRVQTQSRSADATEVFITVSDSGIGIEASKLTEIFKPFKQLDSSLTRKAGGIGMGLAIVERLVAALGGRLECRSELGVGTTFAIDFVFKNAAVSSDPSAEPRLASGSANPRRRSMLRILVVEDNEENLKVLLSMLDHLGYPAPETTSDGQSAAMLVQSKPYDLLLLDVEMPEVDGLTLTRNVRAGLCGPINRTVPIVGVTAFTMEHDREQCLIAGMNEYLAKPLRLSELKEALERI